MTKLAVTLMTAALFFAGIHAFKFDRQPEDDMLDKWLKEQVAETQSSNGAAHGTENLGFATPGHVEEHEYMTAFFENQDHDAFADTAGHGVDNHVDNYLADFFGYGESQNNDKAAVENEDVMGKNVEDFFNNEPETASQTTHQQRQQAAVMKDDPMGKFLSDFFNNEPEPAPQNAPQWREEAVVVNEEKDDGDAESFISDFFDSKNSMERKPGYAIFAKVEEGEEDNAATNNVATNGYAKNYFDDFFNSEEQEIPSHNEPGYAVFAKVEEGEEDNAATNNAAPNDYAKNYFGDFFNSEEQEIPSHNEPADDLELWFQAMGHTNKAEKESKDAGRILKSDFMDNFPEDNLFTFVSVQEMDQECQDWQAKVTEAQTELNTAGKKMGQALVNLQERIDAYEEKLNEKCEKHCPPKCVPTRSDEEECVERVNGTCTLKLPKIDECGERIPDPQCAAEEADCRGKHKGFAEEVKKLVQEKESQRGTVDALAAALMKMVEGIPESCAQQLSG